MYKLQSKKLDSAFCEISFHKEASRTKVDKLVKQGKLQINETLKYFSEGFTLVNATVFQMWQRSANIIESDCFCIKLLINENF